MKKCKECFFFNNGGCVVDTCLEEMDEDGE